MFPVLRNEFYSNPPPVNCPDNEKTDLDLNTAVYKGLGNATISMAVQAAAGNSTFVNSFNGLELMFFATASQNASLAELFTLAGNVAMAAAVASAATTLSTATQAYVTTQLGAATEAYASFTGISISDTAAISSSVNLALLVM